jgi:hypothetical protein
MTRTSALFVTQRCLLLGIGALVAVERRFPLHLGHVPGAVDCERHVSVVERHVAVNSLLDVPADEHGAFAVRRIAEEDARARGGTVAALDVSPFEFPSHDEPPFRSWMLSDERRREKAVPHLRTPLPALRPVPG